MKQSPKILVYSFFERFFEISADNHSIRVKQTSKINQSSNMAFNPLALSNYHVKFMYQMDKNSSFDYHYIGTAKTSMLNNYPKEFDTMAREFPFRNHFEWSSGLKLHPFRLLYDFRKQNVTETVAKQSKFISLNTHIYNISIFSANVNYMRAPKKRSMKKRF